MQIALYEVQIASRKSQYAYVGLLNACYKFKTTFREVRIASIEIQIASFYMRDPLSNIQISLWKILTAFLKWKFTLTEVGMTFFDWRRN